MATIVITLSPFDDWIEDQEEKDQMEVAAVIGQLEEFGVLLPYPASSAIEGSKYALRELRIQSQGRPLRVFYAFDPKRQAVLLIGGCKKGVSDKRFYKKMIRRSEKIWEDYLG